MKKQILILALFVMAIFASVTNSYGQGPTALTPAPGTVYRYEVSPTLVTTNGTFKWYVTTKTDLLDAGIVADDNATFATVGAFYNTATAAKPFIDLNWKPISVGNTYYLVVKYVAESTNANNPATTCTVENMKSYKIIPMNTLLLTVNLATSTGTDNTNTPQICAPNITAATAGAASASYTFGANPTFTLYYNVKASGMLGKWLPQFRIPALDAATNQAYTSVQYSPDAGTNWTTFPNFVAGSGTQDLNFGAAVDADATVAGTNYLVKVVINNANYETLAAQAILLSVDGIVTGTALSDIVGGADYSQAGPFAKGATYTITPRPTLTDVPGANGATFLPKVP